MFLIFFALWLIFNAKFTLEICIFGIVLSALMYLFIWKVFGYKPKYDWLMVKLSLRGIKYFVILIWEIIKANIAVLKLIFTPKVEVKPKLVYFKVDLETNLAKFFLANQSVCLSEHFLIEQFQFVANLLWKGSVLLSAIGSKV